MYQVDKKDMVTELDLFPQISVGAPSPTVLAGEREVLLTFYLEKGPTELNYDNLRYEDGEPDLETVAIIKLKNCYAHIFGPPNDEAMSGHPLSSRGLVSYGGFEVENSSWLRTFEKMNSVHESHNKKQFMEDKKHYIFTFHDSTFECIAASFEMTFHKGTVKDMLPIMSESISE